MYYYVCTVHVIYSSTNFGYTECSRSYVLYTCFVLLGTRVLCNTQIKIIGRN